MRFCVKVRTYRARKKPWWTNHRAWSAFLFRQPKPLPKWYEWHVFPTRRHSKWLPASRLRQHARATNSRQEHARAQAGTSKNTQQSRNKRFAKQWGMTCALSQNTAEDPCPFSQTRLNEDGGLPNNSQRVQGTTSPLRRSPKNVQRTTNPWPGNDKTWSLSTTLGDNENRWPTAPSPCHPVCREPWQAHLCFCAWVHIAADADTATASTACDTWTMPACFFVAMTACFRQETTPESGKKIRLDLAARQECVECVVWAVWNVACYLVPKSCVSVSVAVLRVPLPKPSIVESGSAGVRLKACSTCKHSVPQAHFSCILYKIPSRNKESFHSLLVHHRWNGVRRAATCHRKLLILGSSEVTRSLCLLHRWPCAPSVKLWGESVCSFSSTPRLWRARSFGATPLALRCACGQEGSDTLQRRSAFTLTGCRPVQSSRTGLLEVPGPTSLSEVLSRRRAQSQCCIANRQCGFQRYRHLHNRIHGACSVHPDLPMFGYWRQQRGPGDP